MFKQVLKKMLSRFMRGSTRRPYFGWVLCRPRFKQAKISLLITRLCFGLFCIFFGDFWVYLEAKSFSQKMSKIYGNRKF